MKKVGYLGPSGSYSHLVAKHLDHKTELIGLASFYEIFEALETEKIDIGVLPIENSTEGAVTPVMDALINMKDCKIISEMTISIKHTLLSTAENIKNIKYVLSHPQALEQCREFLKTKVPYAKLIPCESTSKACLLAKENGADYSAIANQFAGEIYQLNQIQINLQDNALNQTRFIVLGKEEKLPTGQDKTSIIFSLYDDRPGGLFEILKLFADKNINLTRIESRPAKMEIGKYLFYIDLLGHASETEIASIFNSIQDKTKTFKILGSYPIGPNL
ncbi:prephenate dehydratase [Serpentinicella sp. ANB-PHB4]|uniref:prephenate dehydratase n=1 Tax=Serpentinicella sp. ANB-PHB4 TaxID=3074076 RepID=UPI002862A1B3|nr:prephenate dehydratase [Serpentinicella sp. ANB-PHB4]MDR5658613.1 prephenate dehydratase [Serpentinicella sp. ANB-PHB4]